MRSLNGREWSAVFILSIVVPVGLLTTFRLTGIVQEPATITETITLEPARWESEPILYNIDIWDVLETTYNNSEISLAQSILVEDYSDEVLAFDGSNTLTVCANTTATATNGYIYEVYWSFREDYENSRVDLLWGEKWRVKLGNLSLISYVHWLNGDAKAFFDAGNANGSSSVYLWFPGIHWVLRSINSRNETRLLEITCEVTYFNGSTFKKIVQPFHLVISPDDNDSFDTADVVTLGEYGVDRLLWLGGTDTQDFYKIYLENNDVINITMTPHEHLGDFDLYLYNLPDMGNPVAISAHMSDVIESISYTIDSAGWWFIEVRYTAGLGFYTFTLTTSTT